MAHETSSWHAGLDLRVFAHLHQAPNRRVDVTPAEALGVRTDLRSVKEVISRIHHMRDAGWIDGGTTNAGVSHATLTPDLRTGLAGWRHGRNIADLILEVLADEDAGRFVDPQRFVVLRDEAVFYC